MLALRTDCSGNPRFAGLLEQVRETTIMAYAHQGLPFEKLVEELRPERNPAYHPLFQMMLSLQNAPVSELSIAELTLSVPQVEATTSKYDLLLDMWEGAEGLAGALEYNSDLFDRATVARVVRHFISLVEGVVSNPERRLSELPLMSEEERRGVLSEWNDTRAECPKERCLHELFERQAETSPDAVAAVLSGLGWFSIGLGLAELLAPRGIAKISGVRGNTGLIRLFGLREIYSRHRHLRAGQATGGCGLVACGG